MRDATADAHTRLDQFGVFSDARGYAHYLEATYAFRVPLERAILASDALSGLSPWVFQPIEFDLVRDLSDLSLSAPKLLGAPSFPTQSGLLGALYVLEGSALGARLLQKAANDLGYTMAFGARHLARQTADSGRWSRFLELFEGHEPFDNDAARFAGEAAFSLATRAFHEADNG